MNWCVIKHKWVYKNEDINFFHDVLKIYTGLD